MMQRLHRQLSRARPRRWSPRLSGVSPGLRRGLSLVALVAVVASMFGFAAWPATTSASNVNVLFNGGFEQGFSSQPGCGMVANGWQCFTNGGGVNYGYYDDQWNRVVAEGSHSQLIELNTKGIMLGDTDRYAGIYQTVPVVDWAEYVLSLKGIIRTTNMDGDPWRYRVQVGWTFGYWADWTRVTNWTDAGWDTYYPRTDPGTFSSYSARLMAEADYVTIYVRVWKKWGVPDEELDVNFDAISLIGPATYGPHPYDNGYGDTAYKDHDYKDNFYGDPG
ncbi:MAG: hypothetical protein H3C34_00845 [Caldilineaceae bacterium]|nr:hypothetical protein [Caldilineaceae bacterium]